MLLEVVPQALQRHQGARGRNQRGRIELTTDVHTTAEEEKPESQALGTAKYGAAKIRCLKYVSGEVLIDQCKGRCASLKAA